MTDREKLIDLISDFVVHVPHEDGQTWEEACADHLISNGVTFGEDTDVHGKWIPVSERLPDESGMYIVTACDEDCPYGEGIWYSTVVVCAEYYRGCWTWYEGCTEYDLSGIVTHWMPLPEPIEEA